MSIPSSVADIKLLGGHPCLDFVNTVDARRDRWGPDFLRSYDDLVSWGQRTGVIDSDCAERLSSLALAAPHGAEEALEQAKALREALYLLFLADSTEQAPPQAASDQLNAVLQKAAGHRAVTYRSGVFSWRWLDDGLDAVLYRIAVEAAGLLTSRASRRAIRECRGLNCGWLFLDGSRGGRRLWCSEETCGTLMRVRRFRGKENRTTPEPRTPQGPSKRPAS